MDNNILLESKTARNEQLAKFSNEQTLEYLNKAKSIIMAVWKGKGFCTNKELAEYYEIPYRTLKDLVKRHGDELQADGMRTIIGEEVREMRVQELVPRSKASKMTLHTPKSALRIGMLLRDSEVAKQVRNLLLNLTQQIPQIVQQQVLPTENFNKFENHLKFALPLAEFLEKRGVKSGIVNQCLLNSVARQNEAASAIIKGVATELGFSQSEDNNAVTPSSIAEEASKLLGEKISAAKINLVLQELGYQYCNRTAKGKIEYYLTKKGQEYGEAIPQFIENGKYKKAIYNIRWKPAILRVLIPYFKSL